MALENLQNLSPVFGNDKINRNFKKISLENSFIFETQSTPILSSFQSFPFADSLVSPPFKLYKNYTYDPRLDKVTGSPLIKNPYVGTRFTKVGLVGGAPDGVGGIFNNVINTSNATNKYSTVFTEINKPKGYASNENEIFFAGNLKNYGAGYPNKIPIYNLFASKSGVSLPKYFPSGASDPNMEAGSWFVGGPNLDVLGGDTYPAFNPLNQGFTSYNNSTTAGLGKRTINIDASQVTANQLKNTSWEDLYNSNHTAKGTGYVYGPNVSTDNLNPRYIPGHLGLSPRSHLGKESEPYNVDSIGSRLGTYFTDEYQGEFAFRDVERLSKYYTSADGLYHIAKQNILGLVGASAFRAMDDNLSGRGSYSSTYVPNGVGKTYKMDDFKGQFLSPNRYKHWGYSGIAQLLAAGGRQMGGRMYSNVSTERTFPFSLLQMGYEAKKVIDDTITQTVSYQKNIGNTTAEETVGMLPGNHPKRPGRQVDVMNEQTIFRDKSDRTGNSSWRRSKNISELESSEHGMPMWFKDLRNNKYLTFRAYVSGLTENVSPVWNPENFMGRSEPQYIYEKTERDINFTLKMFPGSSEELEQLWRKLRYLTSLCYPQYKDDRTLKGWLGAKNRMKPPLTRFRLGEVYGNYRDKGALGFIKSISYSFPDESPWSTDEAGVLYQRGDSNSSGTNFTQMSGLPNSKNVRVPKYISAAITYQVIHDALPNMYTSFYGATQEVVGQSDAFFGMTERGLYHERVGKRKDF